MKRYVRSSEGSSDDLKMRVYDAVVDCYNRNKDDIVDDFEDYKRKYNADDESFLKFLSANRGKYFNQAVVDAVSPKEGKRAIFLLSAMDARTLEDLLFSEIDAADDEEDYYEFLTDFAYETCDLGEPYTESEFEEFKQQCKELGYKVTKEDFKVYLDNVDSILK